MSETRIPLSTLDAVGITRLETDNGQAIALVSIGDAFYAIDDLCTHGEASLSEGELDGFEILCPYHMGAFDVRTGEATRSPCSVDIAIYTVQRDGDEIVIARNRP